MELIGKCKKDFEEWYLEYMKQHSERLISGTGIEFFNLLTYSMQWGVYVDFFDSKSINISIESVFDRMLGYNRGFEVHLYQDAKQSITLSDNDDVFNTRTESHIAAIEKANEIYNNR